MQTVEILEKARELLSDEKHWAKGYYAYNADKEQVFGDSPDAVCWCCLGAIWHSASDVESENNAIKFLDTCIPNNAGIAYWNDKYDTTHDQVLQAFDCAIDKARAAQ